MDSTEDQGNIYLKRKARKKNLTKSHHRSKKQERELAKRMRDFLVPGSGCGQVKGDVRVRGVLRIEAKTTKHKSFSVSYDMVEKMENAVLGTDEMPVIVIEFNDGSGNKLKELAVCPTYVLEALMGAASAAQDC